MLLGRGRWQGIAHYFAVRSDFWCHRCSEYRGAQQQDLGAKSKRDKHREKGSAATHGHSNMVIRLDPVGNPVVELVRMPDPRNTCIMMKRSACLLAWPAARQEF